MANSSPMTAFWVILCLVAGAIEPIVVKLGYRSPATPYQLLAIKALVAAVLILPLTRNFRWIGFSGLKRVSGVCALYFVTVALQLLALKYLSALTVITLLTTTPALVAIINQARGKETLGLQFWGGFFLCFTGVLLNIGGESIELRMSAFGLVCILGAILGSAAYRTRMDDVTTQFPPMLISNYIFLTNGLIALLLILPWAGPIPQEAWPIGIWMGVAGALANVAFLVAIHLLGSTRVSIVSLLQRPLVIVLTALILREPLSWIQVVGIVLVLVGVPLAKVSKTAPQTPSVATSQ